MKEYRFVGSHADELEGGRPIEPGEFTGPIDASEAKNHQLVEDGLLIEVSDGTYQNTYGHKAPEPPMSQPRLTGADLDKRARELDIEGRSDMSADELRDAVAQAEELLGSEEGDTT